MFSTLYIRIIVIVDTSEVSSANPVKFEKAITLTSSKEINYNQILSIASCDVFLRNYRKLETFSLFILQNPVKCKLLPPSLNSS